MPGDLKALVLRYSLHPVWVMAAICFIYVALGTAWRSSRSILLTVPVFFPLVVGLGYDPVWFGIIIVVVMQIGLISPPVGMNMFVVKSMLPRHSDPNRLSRRAAVRLGRDRPAGDRRRLPVAQPGAAAADAALGVR